MATSSLFIVVTPGDLLLLRVYNEESKHLLHLNALITKMPAANRGPFTTIDNDNRWCYHVDGTVREGRADSAKTEFVHQ